MKIAAWAIERGTRLPHLGGRYSLGRKPRLAGAMKLHEGSTIDVVVSSVEQFGLAVEFEDRRGVVLVTNIYWDNVGAQQRMYEEFNPGQRLRVKVLVVAPKQFSASIKDTHPETNPWCDPSIYAPGSMHHGVVRLVFDHGVALVKLENGADVIVEKPSPTTALRDHVDVIIDTVDVKRQQIWGKQV